MVTVDAASTPFPTSLLRPFHLTLVLNPLHHTSFYNIVIESYGLKVGYWASYAQKNLHLSLFTYSSTRRFTYNLSSKTSSSPIAFRLHLMLPYLSLLNSTHFRSRLNSLHRVSSSLLSGVDSNGL